MIGQESLLNEINKYSINTFPRSTLFIGEKGCGKHTLINYIKENILHLDIYDITKEISNDLIDSIYRSVSARIYLINLNEITEKDQNTILKFIEEPLSNSFICLISENENFILNTILNRCVKFSFEPYSYSELKKFLPEGCPDDVLSIIKTPGKLISTNLNIIVETKEYAERIVDKIQLANYSNLLSISDKINFSDEFNKFDLDLLLDFIVDTLFKRYIDTNNINMYTMYKIVLNSRKSLLDSRIRKDLLIQNMLTNMWICSKGLSNG